MAEVPDGEGAITSARIAELRLEPVEGNYDAAHLREVHRRIFQDLPHHHPGEYRPDSSRHRKTRALEGEPTRYIIDYAGSDVKQRVDTILGEAREGRTLKRLGQEEFSQRMAQLYADLDHAHPFREGNSRTLREFTHQLAQDAGYELDWHSTNVDTETRDRLYVARDVAVYERQYPGLNDQSLQENRNHPRFADLHHAHHMLKVFQDRARLETVIRGNVIPLNPLAVQVQVSALKGLDASAFARQAAQHLTETVKSQDLTPAQVREAAAKLGHEAERPLNLSVITSERMSRDMESARQGQMQGFERMFQETNDPASSMLLQKAAKNLKQRGQDFDKLYLTVARSGDQYEGRLEFKTSRIGVVADDQGRHLATSVSSLKGVAVSEEGRVKFTATDPAKIQQQLDD